MTTQKSPAAPKKKAAAPKAKAKAAPAPKPPADPKPSLARVLLTDQIDELQGLYDEAYRRRAGIRQRYKNRLVVLRKELAALGA